MSRRDRYLPVPRTLSSIVGVAAIATAAVGATALGRQQVTEVSAPAVHSAEHRAEQPGAEQHRAVPVHRIRAVRRAQVVRVSRAHTRTSMRETQAAQERAAARAARVRAQTLDRLDTAAVERSRQIERARERRQRLERRRERERQRELARERRIARMNRWVVPVSGYDISATFGAGGGLWASDHTGLDLAAAEGSPVGSAAAGVVTFTGYDGSYGNKVVVTHDDGTETWYCHLSSISVGSGQSVGPGTTVGAVGSTGNSTGPHLHLEVRPGGGGPVDPYSYLQAKGAL